MVNATICCSRQGVVPHQTSSVSNELNAHSAHTEHDHRCNSRGYDRARDHESVGKHLADAMRDNDCTRPSRKMREDKECAEPIMRQEADVPGCP